MYSMSYIGVARASSRYSCGVFTFGGVSFDANHDAPLTRENGKRKKKMHKTKKKTAAETAYRSCPSARRVVGRGKTR